MENKISLELRTALERAMEQCVQRVNESRFRFEPDPMGLCEWNDAKTGLQLTISCSLGVSVGPAPAPRIADPVTEEFLRLAESGRNAEATMLNRLEGDVSNGGFLGLYHDKGTAFMRESLEPLRRIGARSTHALVRQALTVIERHQKTLSGYRRLCRNLERLDERFNNRREQIPVLFAAYRNVRKR